MTQTTINTSKTSLKHNQILERLQSKAENDPNLIGFLVFGSVAAGTHHEKSDIDTISVLRENKSRSGLTDIEVDGIKVGDFYLTIDVLKHGVENVPYLLHPVMNARLLVDKENKIQPLMARIAEYYSAHPEVGQEWNGFYLQLREEKELYGYEKTTIVDVWNKLEAEHSNGSRRRFFDAFYLRNQFVFGIVKRLLVSGYIAKELLSR